MLHLQARLQVEHPVTEAVTGLDLVEWQLRVAAGEALPLQQSQIQFNGHAIEVRLCAEDPAKGFMPQSGRFCEWSSSTALRVEHALSADSEVPPYYDSMVAKLISHGAHRQEALRRLRAGLQDTVALGVTTNQAFLDQCLAHPVFVAGQATTGFIATHQDALLSSPEGLLARQQTLRAAQQGVLVRGNEACGGLACDKDRVRQTLVQKGLVGGDAQGHRVLQSCPQSPQGLLPVRPVADELRNHRVVIGRHLTVGGQGMLHTQCC